MMCILYGMIFFSAIITTGLQGVYLIPFKDMAGTANGVYSAMQTLVGTFLAFLATNVGGGGVGGLLGSLGVYLILAELSFFLGLGCVRRVQSGANQWFRIRNKSCGRSSPIVKS